MNDVPVPVPSSKSKWWIIILVGIILIGAAIFFLYRQKTAGHSPFAKTAQGISFEELLPPDTKVAASFNPSDPDERSRFKKLWDTILQDKKDALLPFIGSQIFRGRSDVPPVENLLETFQKDLRFILGVTPQQESSDPDTYFLASVTDSTKAREFVTKAFSETPTPPKVLRDTKDSYVVYTQDEFKNGGFGLLGDVLFIAIVQEDDVEKLVKRFEKRSSFFWKSKSFASAPKFQKAFGSLSSPLTGYFFIDADITAGTLPPNLDTNPFQTFQFLSFVLSSQSNGFSLDSLAVGDEKAIQSSPLAAFYEPFTASLYQTVPADRAMFFTESHNLGDIILYELDILNKVFSLDKDQILKTFKNSTGLDFQEEFLPFLRRGFSLVLQNTGTVIPGLSFYIDAKDAPEKAKAALAKLDSQIQGLLFIMNTALKSSTDTPVFEVAKLTTTPGSTVSIHLNRISDDDAPISLFQKFTEPIQISFGITGDNILFISTLPNIEQAFAEKKTIISNSLFKEGENFGIEPGTISLFDAEEIGKYFDLLIRFGEEIRPGSIGEREREVIAILAKYLSPIKGLIQIGRGDGVNSQAKSFLKIAP